MSRSIGASADRRPSRHGSATDRPGRRLVAPAGTPARHGDAPRRATALRRTRWVDAPTRPVRSATPCRGRPPTRAPPRRRLRRLSRGCCPNRPACSSAPGCSPWGASRSRSSSPTWSPRASSPRTSPASPRSCSSPCPIGRLRARHERWSEYGAPPRALRDPRTWRAIGRGTLQGVLVCAVVFPVFAAVFWAYAELLPHLPGAFARVIAPYGVAPAPRVPAPRPRAPAARSCSSSSSRCRRSCSTGAGCRRAGRAPRRSGVSRVLGARLGAGFVWTQALFALGHLVVLQPWRIATFLPGPALRVGPRAHRRARRSGGRARALEPVPRDPRGELLRVTGRSRAVETPHARDDPRDARGPRGADAPPARGALGAVPWPRAARAGRRRAARLPARPRPARPLKAFRRLAGKTQVFLAPRGDHYRTRLTHTLEVAQVARSIARALRLNEMLVEAMVMGHDLGHTPFGHAGERILNEVVPGGFHHVVQSVRVVDVLENDGRGLNLTAEVRDGILRHSKGKGNVLLTGSGAKALTLEAEIVRLADIIAYVNHDLDDAVRAGLFTEADVPAPSGAVLGDGPHAALPHAHPRRDPALRRGRRRAHRDVAGRARGAARAARLPLRARLREPGRPRRVREGAAHPARPLRLVPRGHGPAARAPRRRRRARGTRPSATATTGSRG